MSVSPSIHIASASTVVFGLGMAALATTAIFTGGASVLAIVALAAIAYLSVCLAGAAGKQTLK